MFTDNTLLCSVCFVYKDFSKKVLGFPGGSDGEESACSAGDLGLITGSGRSPGEGNGYPLQYSCLENPRTEEPDRFMVLQTVIHD